MTPSDIKSARKRLGLTQQGLAEALRLGPNGERTVRRWEQGDVPVTGPASVAIEFMVREQGENVNGKTSPKKVKTADRTTLKSG